MKYLKTNGQIFTVKVTSQTELQHRELYIEEICKYYLAISFFNTVIEGTTETEKEENQGRHIRSDFTNLQHTSIIHN